MSARQKIFFWSILILSVFFWCYSFAFFIGFGTSGGADSVIKDGQSKGLVPTATKVTFEKTYWIKLESLSDIESPQTGPAGTNKGLAAGSFFGAKFGNGASCNAAITGWYVSATSILNRYRGCIEFWYLPNYASSPAISHIILGDNASDNSYSDIYLQVPQATPGFRFAMRRSSTGDGWIYVNDYSTIWAASELVHIALVWDVVGFKVAGTTYYQAIYVNGSFKAGSTDSNFNNNWISSYINFGYSTDIVSHASGIIDNLKIYNYAKTDFSDRETE